ncbi:MAG: PQQ-binding-like beta-propeller repeat protein [Planctomycetota bacterium]
MVKGSFSLSLVAALLLLLPLACTSDDDMGWDDDHSTSMSMGRDAALADGDMGTGGMDPLIARMRGLEKAVEFIATKKTWSTRFGGGHKVIGAWIRGNQLLAQVDNADSNQFEIHCADVATGKPRWLVVLGDNPLVEAPAAGDGIFAFMTENDSSMVVVNSQTGARLHNMRTSMDTIPVSGAVGAGDTVYVSNYLSGHMTSLAAESGVKGWDFRTRGICRATPVLTSGLPNQLLIYGTDAGEIVALKPKPFNSSRPGGSVWLHNLHGPLTAAPTYASVKAGDATQYLVVFPCEDGWLYGCDPATGRRRWVVRTEKAFMDSAVVLGDRVYARNAERMIVADARSGARIWRAPRGEDQSQYDYELKDAAPAGFELAHRALAANAKNVYMSMGGNKVGRLTTDGGNLESIVDFDQFTHFLTNPATGDLIMGTSDGIFVAFQ